MFGIDTIEQVRIHKILTYHSRSNANHAEPQLSLFTLKFALSIPTPPHFATPTTKILLFNSVNTFEKPPKKINVLVPTKYLHTSPSFSHTYQDACKAQCPIVHYLTGAPEVFTVSIVWDSEESTIYDINTVLKIISMNIDLSNIFVVENKSITTNYRLRGMICYYGKHYIAFFYNHTLKQWYVFDDTNVKAVCI